MRQLTLTAMVTEVCRARYRRVAASGGWPQPRDLPDRESWEEHWAAAWIGDDRRGKINSVKNGGSHVRLGLVR